MYLEKKAYSHPRNARVKLPNGNSAEQKEIKGLKMIRLKNIEQFWFYLLEAQDIIYSLALRRLIITASGVFQATVIRFVE